MFSKSETDRKALIEVEFCLLLTPVSFSSPQFSSDSTVAAATSGISSKTVGRKRYKMAIPPRLKSVKPRKPIITQSSCRFSLEYTGSQPPNMPD